MNLKTEGKLITPHSLPHDPIASLTWTGDVFVLRVDERLDAQTSRSHLRYDFKDPAVLGKSKAHPVEMKVFVDRIEFKSIFAMAAAAPWIVVHLDLAFIEAHRANHLAAALARQHKLLN